MKATLKQLMLTFDKENTKQEGWVDLEDYIRTLNLWHPQLDIP